MNIELFVAIIALLGLLGCAYYIKNYTVPKNANKTPEQSMSALSAAGSEPVQIMPMPDSMRLAMENAVTEMNGYCQAIAYVDTQANRLMGAYSKIAFPKQIIELVASTTTDLFNLPNLIKVSNAFKAFKGQNPEDTNFDAMVIRGMGTVYIFIRAKSNIHRVCVFACIDPEDNNNNNFGLLLRQVRLHLPNIEVAAEAAFLAE